MLLPKGLECKDGMDKMVKSVAIIGSRGYPSFYGGFETLVRHLAPYLADNSWDVTVYGRPGSVSEREGDLDPRVKSKLTRGAETKSLSTLSYGLTSCLDASIRKPDVALVLNVANGYWLPLMKMRGIPTLINVDGIEWEREKWGRAAQAAFKVGAKATAKYGDALVSDSVEIGKRWSAEFGRDSVFIPYGGTPYEGAAESAEFGGKPYVLLVARFVPENTVGEFIEAAAKLSESWDVAIVGSSGYGGELEERVADLDRRSASVHWFGHISDDDKLFSLWANASAYFHGHSVGGTNPALVQAMACGAPIVARDTVFNREVLMDSALYTSPDPDDIVRAVSRLMSDVGLQGSLRLTARQRVSTHYSWDGVCEQYDAALTHLCN